MDSSSQLYWIGFVIDSDAPTSSSPAVEISLRDRLRVATEDVHQRLHQHSGFAAVQRGTISRGNYAKLLVRLSGFHQAFEGAARVSNERSHWLSQDLAAIRGEHRLVAEPLRPAMPKLDSPDRVLGALYVVEGSALGGRSLARELDTLLGVGESSGRRFFEGRGSSTGAAWRDFVRRLDLVPAEPKARAAAVDAAVELFSVFEAWLAGWRTADVGRD